MVKINDADSFLKWLERQSQEVAAALSVRLAMRLWPAATMRGLKGGPERMYPVILNIHKLMIAEVAIYSPTAAILKVVESARTPDFEHTDPNSGRGGGFADAAVFAAAASTPIINAQAAAIVSAVTNPASSYMNNDTTWEAVNHDANEIENGSSIKEVMQSALFPTPKTGNNDWLEISTILALSNSDYYFWIDWYERALEGSPQNWEMLEEIALIDPKDWDLGAEHVNGLIAEIQAKYLRAATMIAETVGVRDDTGLIYFEPVEIIKPDDLSSVLNRVADALKHATGGNGLSENSFEAKTFNLLIDKYSNDPQRIEMDLEEIRSGLEYQLSTNELPESLEIRSLMDRCTRGALAIRSTNKDVAEAREMRARQFLREIPPDVFEEIEKDVPALLESFEVESADKFDGDIAVLRAVRDRHPIPFPDGATPLPAANAMDRIANRVAKISLFQSSGETLDKLEKNPLYRGIRFMLTINGLVSIFSKLVSWIP